MLLTANAVVFKIAIDQFVFAGATNWLFERVKKLKKYSKKKKNIKQNTYDLIKSWRKNKTLYKKYWNYKRIRTKIRNKKFKLCVFFFKLYVIKLNAIYRFFSKNQKKKKNQCKKKKNNTLEKAKQKRKKYKKEVFK